MTTYAIYAIEDDVAEPEVDDAEEVAPEDEDDDIDVDEVGYTPELVETPTKRHRVGTVRLGDDGMLALVSAEPGDKAEVELAIKHMNEKGTLFLKLPPEEDDPHFSVQKVPVERGEPEFFDALQDNLRRFHGMELDTEAG